MLQSPDRRESLPVLIEDIYPLNPVQQGMVFHDLLAPDRGVYLSQYVFTLQGTLEAAVLRRAWQHVVDRSPMLRTVFAWEGMDKPLQVVLGGATLSWEELDWREVPRAGQPERMRRYLESERERRFNLLVPPLMRLALVRRAEDEWELVWSYHHLLLDGWSISLVLQDVLLGYDALVRGRAPAPARRRPYRDYIAWLQRQDLAAAQAYWRGVLAGFESPTPLPADRLAGPAGEPAPGEAARLLSPGATAALRAFAKQGRLTINTLVQGAWALLLGRYSGEDDVVFGAVVTGRPPELAGMERIVGLFINTLPVRVGIEGAARVDEWMQRLQTAQQGARAYEFSPLIEVQRWSDVPAGQALFESIVAFENHPVEEMAGAGERSFVVARWAREGRSHYPLELMVLPGERLSLLLEYDGGRIDADAAERLAGHLETLLEGLAADPARRLSEVPLMRESERARLLTAWNATGAEYPRERCIHELFAEQAARTPAAVALVSGGRELTYAELERRSNQLAHRLLGLGVRPEDRVGLCLERGPEMVVALLAVLKAGGAYLPLDPSHPAERLAYMLGDAGASVLLTQAHLTEALPPFAGARLCLDSGGAAPADEPTVPPTAGADARSLAYVIYTSGSTGRPKGVAVPHRAVVNFLASMRARPGLTAGDTLLAVTTLSFDIAGLELFLPLTTGARVVLADRQTASDGLLLREALAGSGATTMQATPASWRMLLEAEWQGTRGLKALCGGEALPRDLAERVGARVGELWNLYGPTETTIWSTLERVVTGVGAVPIGRPIANTRVYLLDGDGEPVPVGVAGELYIGGEGVARGYLGRPELTAERFVPDGFASAPGGRLYRTGDRVRWRADGKLEYLARTDQQVKVRGFRIEPGEIETALREQPGVREAVVLARTAARGGTGDRRLVAYVVAQEGVELSVQALKARLHERLPEYMVPASFVTLPALPLTPNGKVDRRALPAPERGSGPEKYTAPRTEAEEILCGVWAGVLKLERVGVEENFFELGGDSILSVQLVSRARQRGLKLTPKQVFERPTVARLAAVAEREDPRVAHYNSPGPGGYTPSGFSLAGLGQGALDALLGSEGGVEDVYPLTPLQEGMLFHALYAPDSGVYVGQFGFVLEGPLDALALERAWEGAVARHEALRAGFTWEGLPRPVQVVRREAELPFRKEDWRGLDEAEQQARLERYLDADRAEGFRLAQSPLMRLALFRVGEAEHRLVWTHHHLVLDGWSLSLIFRDVLAAYEAFGRGEAPQLARGLRYRDYVAWLERQDHSGAERFWRQALAGFEAPTPLPASGPRRGVDGEEGQGGAKLRLSVELTRALREQARRGGVTLSTLVQGAWALLLSRYAGEDDVVFGATVSGRPAELAGVEETVGLFINTIPVRVRLRADARLGEWLSALQREQVEAREYGYAPLVEVRRWSEVPAGEELFRSLVVYENYPIDQALGEHADRLRGLRVRGGFGREQTNYPLLLVAEAQAELRAELRYDRGLVDDVAAQRLPAHLEAVLEVMATHPERRLSEVSLLRPAERVQVLETWNATAAGLPRACVHELFSDQAKRTPGAVAVASRDESLTYAELECRAARLARSLRRLGVRPERCVGLCVRRSPEMVVGLLGILKAGGVYLPLDPAYPPERLAYMLADSGASVLVVEPALSDILPSFAGARVCLDAAPEAATGESDAPRGGAVSLENAAYVIYTSGSTGMPKGVVVTHANAANLLPHAVRAFKAGARSRVLQTASMSFDASLLEVFVALLSGAALHVVEREVVLSPEHLGALLREREISVWVSTPALLDSLLESDFPALRTISTGGERCSAETAARWSRGRRLVNMYGPTETTIYTTAHECAPGAGEAPPIGRPVANTLAYVLDAWGGVAPVGVPGDLYVGGAGVARGYLGRADLTAERFVPDPFSSQAGARLYRTGDQVRRRADGELEFLGRIDRQVKIRGFRIEPGEVEAALLEREGVHEAVVVVREDAPGQKHLVAYVVAEEGADFPGNGLRMHLSQRLPEHLVPGTVVVLEKLPLTLSGKVDRRALPAPERETAAHLAPRTATEEILSGIWAEVLGVERVSVEAGFFELGGHSLLAMQVVSRARQALRVEVPLRALFEAPTVAALAARIEGLRRAGEAVAPPVERVGRGEPLPPSFAQQRLWLVDRLEPGSAAYNMPFALRLRGALDVAALRAGLDELVRRHEALRTTFAEREGTPVQVIHQPAPVLLAERDLRALPDRAREAEAERLAREEALRPFDLARGPLLRSTLLRLDVDDHVLCITLHHVVSDGWSMRVLVREVSALYGAFARGDSSPLPELPVQYADYAVWQRAWLQGGVLEKQTEYWKERLAGAPPLLEIPTDRPRVPGQDPRAESHAFVLPPDLTKGLRALSRREGTTLFVTLLTGWQVLLGRYAAQEDVVVGSPIAGRTRRETEGLIGFFVNMLPLRADLAGDPTWSELLRRAREETLRAYDHQELPFERLVEELSVERSLTHSPVFQVVFTLDLFGDEDVERLEPGDLALEPFGGGERVAKFDLELVFSGPGERLDGVLVYRPALFQAETIARMAGHLEATLEALAADPARRLSELSLLRGSERAQLLAGSRAEAVEHSPACVHELFAAQAARTPELVAAAGGGEALSYAELERRSNRLAHHLRARGVGPEVRVGVCLDGGVEMLVAVLGVLKAGGAYVPLDPSYPAERLAYTLGDSAASLLLTRSALLRALPAFGGAVVRLDTDGAAIGREPDAAPRSGADVHNAAYVVYTSGSTGLPKGVVVEHAGLANTLLGARETFGPAAGEIAPALASHAFDIWGFEVFLPLLSGGRVLLPAREAVRDTERLVQDLAAVDAVHAVPALMREVAARVLAGPGTLPRMRRVFVGGDAVPPDLIGLMRRVFPAARLWVLYGPTEASILGAASLLRAEGGYAWQVVGRALPGVGLYVCDTAGGLLPDGVAGELCIGGTGVARGYLGRADLTADRFVPDAFGGAPGARLYRTGDRVRRRADGELEFLGRLDQQVKIRGFRIEPGEIEAALLEHDAVREAVAVVREDAPGGKGLVAYVVAQPGAEVSGKALRAHLSRRLPEHLVPGAFVVLEKLPLTVTGKVDRRQLPAPDRETAAYVAPRTATEEVVAGIWAEVLGVERVGVEAGFFELGGHSLLATQVVSRVRRTLGVELPLRVLFETPTVASLAGHVDGLRAAGAGAAPAIGRVPRDGAAGLPLSFAQQRLWLIQELDPASPAYNMPGGLRLRGAPDAAALERALAEVVRRHEALRTVFPARDGVPVQVVRPAGGVHLPVVDLRTLPAEAGEQLLRVLAREEAVRPFDLARGPLLRFVLLRLADHESAVLFTMHHIVGDAWSTGVLVRELSALYAAFSRGLPSPLSPLPIQYADFAAWQREHVSGRRLEEQLEYWKRRLAGAPALLELPTDRPRPAVEDPAGAVHPFTLDADLVGALNALARREGTTLFVAVLAGLQLLLARYGGQDDVLVGSPVANRTHLELEGLIGFFANTLVLRTDLSGDPTARGLLARVKDAVLEAQAHQDLPFERLVAELQPERSLAHSPFFQALLTVQKEEGGSLTLGELDVRPLGSDSGTAKFDLTWSLEEHGGALAGGVSYRTALWDDATIARMVSHLRAVLAGIAAEPERRVSGLELLAEAEREEVLRAWNDTAAEYPLHEGLRELFRARAASTPGATALVSGGERLTYAELLRRAARLAERLRSLGVGVDSRVGLCVERSTEMVVGVLGIVEAGGAYVPIDPGYPEERVAYMLEDAGVSVLVTQERLAARLPATAARVVVLDGESADEDAPAHSRAPALPHPPFPDSLAYVVYTSGSTGRPKGVAMHQRPLLNLLAWQARAWERPGAATTLQFATISFDASFHEIFSCLLGGGTLVLAPEEARRDPAALLELLEREEVERLFLPYVALQHVAEEAVARGVAPPRLREVQTAGEQLRVTPAIRRWLGMLGAPLHNHYGPSETHVVTALPLRGDPAAWPVLPGIGTPIANSRCYVVDGGLRPTPAGVPGELYLGGDSVARGYLGRPELTAERFVPDPFSGVPGARLYRSGDRARWLASGEIEFLGRVDQQVKVRGFRIEPGEVEAALERHPGVREALVYVREDVPGDRRLVGYVVPEADREAPADAELRGFLAGSLPEFMVPAAFVALERLPLTSSGKIDRRTLPAPERVQGAAAGAPRTAAEEVLAGIWAEVLRLERVGVEENFFGLGGHSLVATQVVSRARQAFGVEVPLRALFEAPTVAALALRIGELRNRGGTLAPPIRPVPRGAGDPLPPSFAQQRLWLVDRLDPGSAAYNIPGALRMHGALDAAALRASLAELVRRHEALRTVFAEHGGAPVQIVRPPAAVPLPLVDLRGAPDPESRARRLAAGEALRPFDLARGPLLRCTLLRLGDDDHVLLFTMHHVVGDGWSLDVLVRELSAFYAAFSRGEAPRLPELPVQYADFAAWQRGWLSGENLEEQVGYWKGRLAGAPPLLEVPTDRPRRVGQSPREASHRVTLASGFADGLRALSRREGTTLFMTVLAAWQALLGRHAGQEDVVVGTAVAGRSRLELEGLIGFFVNMLVLRADLSGDPDWAGLLARVREETLGAFEHQDLPFERLVEELAVERSLTHSPVFQATFALRKRSGGEDLPSPGGLVLEPFGGEGGVAQYDLGLSVVDGPATLDVILAYRESLFEAATVARMAQHLETLLEAMVAGPGRRLSEAPLLRGAERAQVLEAWNATAAGFPRERCVHELFAEQAARTPHAVALVAAGTALTYAGLEHASDLLAHRLVRLGVGPEAPVGLCLERGPEMVVALLGILKAGGAYLPLDPSYPAERLAYMLGDSGASVLLTHEHLRELLPRFDGDTVLLNGHAPSPGGPLGPARRGNGKNGRDDSGTLAHSRPYALPHPPSPENLAYVIYTSGSTGRPKGVAVPHRAVVNFLASMRERPGLSAGDTLLAVTTLSFDIAALELFLPLTTGARVVIADRETASDGVRLGEALAASGATAMQATPASWRMLLDAGWEGTPGLKALCGGEALPRELADRVGARCSELWNLYGPTETTIWSTCLRVGAGAGAVPIGGPIANTRVYLLDASLAPVPVGVPGELYLGGEGVARGYLGRPELTAERFLPDGFSGGAGERLYRTGDRARRLAGGELEYLGRTDAQVKVRGFRIELGEVEAALREQAGVREAAAAVREDAPGHRRLVAYVVAEEGGEAPTAAGLRAVLRERLPEHMVPGEFVALERLPLTANGKTDRRALPAPERVEAEYAAPRTEMEELLCEIWLDVLGSGGRTRLERVGIHDSFFDLGGHSLLAMQVLGRIREVLDVQVPPRVLFRSPTVADLATEVEDRFLGALDAAEVAEELSRLELAGGQDAGW